MWPLKGLSLDKSSLGVGTSEKWYFKTNDVKPSHIQSHLPTFPASFSHTGSLKNRVEFESFCSAGCNAFSGPVCSKVKDGEMKTATNVDTYLPKVSALLRGLWRWKPYFSFDLFFEACMDLMHSGTRCVYNIFEMMPGLLGLSTIAELLIAFRDDSRKRPSWRDVNIIVLFSSAELFTARFIVLLPLSWAPFKEIVARLSIALWNGLRGFAPAQHKTNISKSGKISCVIQKLSSTRLKCITFKEASETEKENFYNYSRFEFFICKNAMHSWVSRAAAAGILEKIPKLFPMLRDGCLASCIILERGKKVHSRNSHRTSFGRRKYGDKKAFISCRPPEKMIFILVCMMTGLPLSPYNAQWKKRLQ